MRIHRTATGLSVRTQDMYTLVFVTRYVDLMWSHHHLYITTLKIVFVFLSLYLSYATRAFSNKSRNLEFVPRLGLVTYAAVIASLFWFYEAPHTLFELSWKFSIALESVAILPQLMLLPRIGIIEAFTVNYLVLLGMYRILYLASWLEQWVWNIPHAPRTTFIYLMTLVQNALYIDIIYLYIKYKRHAVSLPVTIKLDDATDSV